MPAASVSPAYQRPCSSGYEWLPLTSARPLETIDLFHCLQPFDFNDDCSSAAVRNTEVIKSRKPGIKNKLHLNSPVNVAIK